MSKALLRLSRLRRNTIRLSIGTGRMSSITSKPTCLGALPDPRKVVAHRLRPACDGPSLNPCLLRMLAPPWQPPSIPAYRLVPVTTWPSRSTPSLRARSAHPRLAWLVHISERLNHLRHRLRAQNVGPPARENSGPSGQVLGRRPELAGRAPSPRRRARALGGEVG